MFTANNGKWAEEQCKNAELGDLRRTKRLIQLTTSLVNNIGASVCKAQNDTAELEAAYRFIRNDNIKADAIADSGFQATAAQVENYNLLLALEDTTTLNVSHDSIRDEMGHITSNLKSRGMLVHSSLLFAPEEQHILGLIDQHRWTRDINAYGQKKHTKTRKYEDKESIKWEKLSQDIASRLGDNMEKVISVCDRESDVFEYISYKTNNQQRFVVRAKNNRCIEGTEDRLFDYISKQEKAGFRKVKVPQKGGRKARVASCEVRYAKVNILAPNHKKGASIPLYYVGCREVGDDSGLCWHLLTTEPVDSKEQAEKILEYYEKRWLIEDFHKSWKTGGTRVEDLRMRSKANLEKMLVILSFISVRIQQLRYLGLNTSMAKKQSCELVLSKDAWNLLWRKYEKKRLPKKAPSMHWAYLALGKLGGWKDTQRNGRVGWVALWEGWFLLQTMLEGVDLIKQINSDL